MVAKDNAVIFLAESLNRRRQSLTPGRVRTNHNRYVLAEQFRRRELVTREDAANHREVGQLLDAEIFTEARFQVDMNGAAAVAFEFKERGVELDDISRKLIVIARDWQK